MNMFVKVSCLTETATNMAIMNNRALNLLERSYLLSKDDVNKSAKATGQKCARRFLPGIE